jgi:hypothetical protein
LSLVLYHLAYLVGEHVKFVSFLPFNDVFTKKNKRQKRKKEKEKEK